MASPAGSPMRRWFHGIGFRSSLAWTRRAATVTGSLVAAVLAASPEGAADLWPPLESVVRFGHDTAWIWLTCAIVVGAAANWLWGRLRHPAVSDATNAILDEFQEALFAKTGGDYAHHRVTLFKRVSWRATFAKDNAGRLRWPWSGWLVPVARSGHGTRQTGVRFLCPDDTDHAQGVAGRAWASFRVEDARSNPWGVLVVDSRLPGLNVKLAQERFISPFEIPRGVRGFYDQDRKQFMIEFKYITREPSEVDEGGPPEIKTLLGRKTGRILGFEIDVDALNVSTVSLRLGAIDQALKAVKPRTALPRPENSRIASRVLHDRSEELFGPLPL